MQATKLVIHTCAGEIEPMGPGRFLERHVRSIKHQTPVETYTDDPAALELIETGSFKEDMLAYRKKRITLKEIYDVDLLSSDDEHTRFKQSAITHFGLKELNSFANKLKPSIKEIQGDVGLQEIDDLATKYMEENGGGIGKLVYMKNSIIIVDPEDFELHLREVAKKHRKSRIMCGAFFCTHPHKVVKAVYTGKVRLG